ncbi:MAG: DUF4912 domain-containing protein [Candidatus Magnetominusculus sp. LBB02]|nr:DUF4912 domain-containing protein [Candidatus Magnetominusculus sp. LBB02]
MEDAAVNARQEEGKVKVSEDGHGIAYLLSDTLKYPIVGEYEIPVKYNTDTLVILPITDKKVYIYWELTEKLLMERTQNPAASYFTVKIYEITLGQTNNYREKEMYSVAVTEPFGQIYAECTDTFKPMAAAIGIERDGAFTALLKSNQINVPSFSVLGLKEEFWSKGILHTEEKNVDEVMDAAKDSNALQGKSDIFEKEMEIITKFLDIRFKDTDNIELILRLIERIKHLTDDEKALLDLIKSFFETRSKDVQLLSLFLEFLKFLGLKEGSKGSIMKYFDELKGITGSSEMSGAGESAGSSEMSGKRS